MFTNIVQQIKQKNIMKEKINTIETILANFGLHLDDFFIVSFWKTNGEVSIQGHNSPELFSKLSKLVDHGFVLKHHEEVNQWHFNNSKIKVSIVIS
jgi:hypothetical protein